MNIKFLIGWEQWPVKETYGDWFKLLMIIVKLAGGKYV